MIQTRFIYSRNKTHGHKPLHCSKKITAQAIAAECVEKQRKEESEKSDERKIEL
jgi:hypothetical protein